MTQEDKKLLLNDLCARLPYGVMYATEYGPRIINDLFIYSNGPVYTDHGVGDYNEVYGVELENIKPYLRPMSSMTEDEKTQYRKTQDKISVQWDDYGQSIGYVYTSTIKTYDWLNAHHFDYRGLIEKGLALEAPEGMYKFE